jgi:ParB family chromosome partitioning protein
MTRRRDEMREQGFSIVSLDSLVLSNKNPRSEFRDIDELSENIKAHGVLQPIIVRPCGNNFEVVVGERRVRASMKAGLKEIPTIIKSLTDNEAGELRLIENVHRDDLTNAEKGDAVIDLWENYPERYPTFKSIAEGLNVKYDTLQMWLRYSRKLSELVRDFVSSSKLGEDHARFLLKYDKSTQNMLAEILIKHSLSTTEARRFLKLYDKNSNGDLDKLAQKSKGVRIVKVSLESLPLDVRKEVKRIAEDKSKSKLHTEEIKKKRLETFRRTLSRRKERKQSNHREETNQLLQYVEEKPSKRIEKIKTSPILSGDSQESISFKTSDHISHLTEQVVEQIKETLTQAPDKANRISEIVDEELKGMRKRLELFPEKSKKIESKFKKFRALINRGVIPYTIWDFQYRDDYAGSKDFHGNCSPQIVEQCIWRLTKEGDLVVDPMAGSGTALDVCKRFKRKFVGYDIKPAKDRPDIIQNDSRKIPLEKSSVDMVFIHPPYWNLAYFTKAEESLSDLSRAENVDEFMNMLEQVFRECYRILKPGKFMCVLLGDLIREGKFVPLCRKTINMAENVGFIDYGHAIKLAHGEVSRKKSGVIIAEPIFTDNLKISHDFVMFLRKSS